MLVFRRGGGIAAKLKKTNQSHLDAVSHRAHLYFREYLGHAEAAQQIWQAGQKIVDLNERAMFYAQAVVHVEQELSGKPSKGLQDFAPVSSGSRWASRNSSAPHTI